MLVYKCLFIKMLINQDSYSRIKLTDCPSPPNLWMIDSAYILSHEMNIISSYYLIIQMVLME